MTLTSPFRLRVSLMSFSAGMVIAFALTGCAGFVSTATNPVTSQLAVISGNVHGGQQPVSGSHIYMYAAATGATYGAAATSLITLTGPPVQTDPKGNNYVTTDANGNFNIAGNYSCPGTAGPLYLLAVGGNPGLQPPSTSNNAITLMAELGPCSSVSTSTISNINEVTTVAAVTALQQFMVDPVHMGTSPNNLIGLTNAAASVANIVDRASGLARSTNLLGTGSVPLLKINSLGNLLAPCINSASNTSAECTSLFTAATPTGGTAPTDVTSAMLLIAQNPGNNVSTLFGLQNSNAPFLPSLSGAPNDFTIGITYRGGGLSSPGDVVIDAVGNAWTANCPNCTLGTGTDTIVGFGPQGAILSGATGYTTGVHRPQGIAIDQEGYIWVASIANGTAPDEITRLAQNGSAVAGFPFRSSFLDSPTGIAIDGSSNAWITDNGTPSYLLHVGYQGNLLASTASSAPCPFVSPEGIAVDPIGDVFMASTGNSSIVGFYAGGQTNCFTNVGGLNQPIGISISQSDNLWTVDNGTNNITELDSKDGTPLPGSPYPGGYQLAVLAIAGDNTVWFANCKAGCPGSGSLQPDNVIHLASSGSYLTSSAGYEDPNFNAVGVAAIDRSGNLWVSNNVGGSLTELLGVAAPVLTPLASAVLYNLLGQRP